MLILTKNFLENIISTSIAKDIALLVRSILQRDGFKAAQMSLNNMFSVKSEFLPVLSKFYLQDHRKCHILCGYYRHSLVAKIVITRRHSQNDPGKNFQLDSNYFAFLT